MRYVLVLLTTLALLTGCSSAIEGKPTAAPVTDEWRNAVIAAVAQLGNAMGPIANAMAPTNYPALRKSCGDLRTSLDTMQHEVLPGPDINVNSALRDGIAGFRSMADQCVALTPDSSPTELRKLSTTIDRADKRMKDALALLGVKIPRR